MKATKMTVKELIEQLEGLDPDAEVHIAYNYGDHWRTQVAPSVSEVFEAKARWSEYHSMDAIQDDEDDNERNRPVVVIR